MKEEYLHYLWREKAISFRNLELTDGRKLEILNTGWYNVDSGPDFFNGMIKIDGIVWSGNIEMHLNSSDWFKHQHQTDQAYDNVILHVVLNYDKPVFLNDQEIPTVVIKNKIDNKHYSQYKDLITKSEELPCKKELQNRELVAQQIQNSLQQRLHRKAADLQSLYKENGWSKSQVLAYSFMIAFGGRLNKMPLMELLNILPLNILVRESWSCKRVESFILGCSGLLNQPSKEVYHKELLYEWKLMKQKYKLVEMNPVSWKFGGVRPYNFPTFKLAQLARFITEWKFNAALIERDDCVTQLRKLLSNSLNIFWEHHFHFNKATSKKHNTYLSDKSKDLIIINALPTYLFFLAQVEGDFKHIDRALEILNKIPNEQNFIIKDWMKKGVPIKSAGDSQGLIELRNEFCNFRRCLSCSIGQNILKN